MLAVGTALTLAAVAPVLALLVLWIVRKGALLWVAGVDPAHVQTRADRARYTSMGAIVVLTASAATASLTIALTLVFSGHGWLRFLPVGLVWGAIVFNFDRWIVSSFDYGPLSAEDKSAHHYRWISKIVQFLVRLTMAALVGLVISEPIVLAIFGPEISQQLVAQHTADATKQARQIYAAQQQRLAVLERPVQAADAALAIATAAANNAHKIYLCEVTARCDLPPGEVTGQVGAGPQAALDFTAWQRALGQQQQDQRIANQASATERTAAASLARQTSAQIAAATRTVDADNGLLAREKALDTLSRQNPGFLLRRVILWLALMFIDLAPVLLKTFSPKTLHDLLARSEAIRIGRNAITEAERDSDHESSKKAITREFDLEFHRMVTELEYGLRLEAVRAGSRPAQEIPESPPGTRPEPGRTADGTGPVPSADIPGAGHPGSGDGGRVIGRRWQVQRSLTEAPTSGRVPFVATDLFGEYPFEVVVKIVAPPPGVAGTQALQERRHAQMEMSLPQGHIHDNIAEVLDCDLDPRHGFYLVTRLYPGTLEQHLRRVEQQDPLSVGQVLQLAVQILAGLHAAWDRGFVHLDLKPANIALTEEGTVKLIDFGLAQHYQKANGGNDTMAVARFTPFYAPPEQMERRDASWISRYADLRALGAVIYRMLTGHPPMFREARALGLVDPSGRFDAAGYFDVKELVAAVEPVPVGDLIPGVPQELDMLLRAWLRIDPQMRCPGKPGTMPERVSIQLAAVADQVQTAGRSDDLVGPRVTVEPDFADLRAQWDGRPGRPNRPSRRGGARHAGPGDARSGETLEVVQSTRPEPVSFADPSSAPRGTGGVGTLPWMSMDDDPPRGGR
jgi:serine/threonine protein kinase